MRVVLVGQKNGKAVIRWPQYACLSFVLSMFVGMWAGGTFYLVAGRWSHDAVLYGIAIGLGIVGVGLLKGLRTPPDRLSPID